MKKAVNLIVSLKNILFATDFSEASQAALPYAAAIARRYDSQLHIAHIMSPASYIIPSLPGEPVTLDSIHEAARADVRQRMETLGSHLKTVPHHTYVREGDVWESLADLIQTHEIDLLVVGTHGRAGVEKLVLGSKAEEILRLAPCPVLAVGPQIAGKAKLTAIEGEGKDLTPVEISVGQIVYATDFSPESLAAAPFATSLAQEFQSKLTVTRDREAQEQEPPDGTDRSRSAEAGEVGAGGSQPVVLTQTDGPSWLTR
jgi:nucleotide-binding universal stress UspA family protein